MKPMILFRMILWLLCLAPVPAEAQAQRNIRFGKPDGARPYVTDNADDWHISRPQYVLSHNATKGHANWVSWNLRKADLGDVARGEFEVDDALPIKPRVSASWYANTGFDIGHLCPSKDRSATRADNDATFLMSNVVPQAPVCNEQTWNGFESYCRKLAGEGRDLHIVAGPSGTRGHGKLGWANSISMRRINVPAYLWKVVIVLPNHTAKPDKSTRVIAAIVPNTETVHHDWMTYKCSTAHAEEVSMLKLFPDAEIDREKIDKEP